MRTRWLLIGVGLLTAVLAIGAVACDDDEDEDGDEVPTATVVEGEMTPVNGVGLPEPTTITLEEVGGSGIAGTATLTALGNDIEVELDVTGLQEGNTYISGAYDSTSVNCTGGLLGSFSGSFGEAASGMIYTVPGTTVSDGDTVSVSRVISVSVRDITETGEAPGTVVACGEVDAAAP